jgi:hypothetical protein
VTATQAVVPCPSLPVGRSQSRKEICKERLVNEAALGVILHGASERIFAQVYLLNNAVVRGPGIDFQIVSELFDCLVMCTIYL